MEKPSHSNLEKKMKPSDRSRSRERENVATVGSELDFIADGHDKELSGHTKSKAKNKKPRKTSTDTEAKEKKKSGRKSSSSCIQWTCESLRATFDLAFSATCDYLQQKNEEMSQLKQFGSLTAKTIKDIQKLELLTRSLECHRDMLTNLKQGLSEDSKDVDSDDVLSMLGKIKLGISGLSDMKTGDHFEVVFLCGTTKYRMKGSKKSERTFSWNAKEIVIQPISCENILIKVSGSKVFGKSSTIGNATLQVGDLIKLGSQTMEVALNKSDETIKMVLNHTWMPFDVDDIPQQYQEKSNKNENNDDSPFTADGVEKENHELTADKDKEYVKDDISQKERKTDSFLVESKLLELAFMRKMQENANAIVSESLEPNENEEAKQEEDDRREGDKEVWAEALYVVLVFNHVLGDYRGRYQETQLIEIATIEILEELQNCTERHEGHIIDALNCEIQSCEKPRQLLSEESSFYQEIASKFSNITFNDDQEIAYAAVIAHLKYGLEYLKDVGTYGPLKVKEIIALHRLYNQGKILRLILDVGRSPDLELEDFPELAKRRTLLEFWRSCCDGETELSVSAKILCLELESEFGRAVKNKHPDVANRIFHELICRLLGQNVASLDGHVVTVFQILQFCEETESGNQIEDLAKIVDKLGLEMFLASALRSDNNDLILVAIKKVGTLLALRTSNLCALAHLLLNQEKIVRSAAAAHIIHIGKDLSLRDRALASYVELLESTLKRDRQSSCVALGFLGAKECIPQLAYLYHSDVDNDVREAATHALNALGDEGKLALEHAASTLLAQTMAQRVALNTSMRLGTSL